MTAELYHSIPSSIAPTFRHSFLSPILYCREAPSLSLVNLFMRLSFIRGLSVAEKAKQCDTSEDDSCFGTVMLKLVNHVFCPDAALFITPLSGRPNDQVFPVISPLTQPPFPVSKLTKYPSAGTVIAGLIKISFVT